MEICIATQDYTKDRELPLFESPTASFIFDAPIEEEEAVAAATQPPPTPPLILETQPTITAQPTITTAEVVQSTITVVAAEVAPTPDFTPTPVYDTDFTLSPPLIDLTGCSDSDCSDSDFNCSDCSDCSDSDCSDSDSDSRDFIRVPLKRVLEFPPPHDNKRHRY